MHLRKIHISNIRAIRTATWSIPKSKKTTGWHVVLGNNGSGKSSFLRAIAMALTGPEQAYGLRQAWNDWLTRGEQRGEISLELSWNYEVDKFVGKGRQPKKEDTIPVHVAIERCADKPDHADIVHVKTTPDPTRHIWNSDSGWFSAAYGPFRRFSGGDAKSEKAFYSMPRLARHLSIFDERIALTECLEWLRDLQFRRLEKDPEGQLLARLTNFINQSDFLPSAVKLEAVTSRGVVFRDANRVDVDVQELSDGYRSILSMTFELIRQMSSSFGPEAIFDPTDPTRIVVEGVVLIDEVDAHLHPTWQRAIGGWFCRHFPNVQFIISTHSPLVCQAAECGSVFLLPDAGTEGTGRMLKGKELNRLLFGNILDAYGTEAFGKKAAATRSPKSREFHQRLAFLNNKQIATGLSAPERAEQEHLREMLPSEASKVE